MLNLNMIVDNIGRGAEKHGSEVLYYHM